MAAAQRAGVRRIVAESVIFAYGYPTTGPAVMDETDPYPGPPPKGGDDMLAALRGMERNVLSSGEHSDTEGIVLRYGCFYGPGVPHDELFVRLAKWCMLPAMTGNGIVSWIHIDDVAKATADAVDHGRGGQIYNIVDDRPQSFGDYVRELSSKLHRPRPIPISHRLVGLVASYPATAFGTTWLPLSNAKAKAELGWTRASVLPPVKFGVALLERRGDALGEVLRRQHRRVPHRHVAQAFRDPRDALLIQHVLDAADGQRRVGGDLGGGFVRGRQRCLRRRRRRR